MSSCESNNLFLQDGLSPLYSASQEGHTEIVDMLLKKGADPNLATTVCMGVGVWLLHVHCSQRVLKYTYYLKCLAVYKYWCMLPQSHVHPSMQEKSRAFPLAVAAQVGHTQIVKRLLKEKVNINKQNGVRGFLYYIAIIIL